MDNKFPIINIDEKYILREIAVDDYQEFYRYFGDSKVNKYILSDIPKNLRESIEEVRYWRDVYYKGYGVYWAIAEKKGNKLIGTIGFNNWNKYHNRIELSYDMAKEYWGRGIMSKALKKSLAYVFDNMSINRVEAFVLPKNKSSFYLLKNNGFVKEALLEDYRLHDGKYYDLYMFSITKVKYKKFKKRVGKITHKIFKRIMKSLSFIK